MSIWDSWVAVEAPERAEEPMEMEEAPEVAPLQQAREERALAAREANKWRQVALRLKAALQRELQAHEQTKTESQEWQKLRDTEFKAHRETKRKLRDLNDAYAELKRKKTAKKPKKAEEPKPLSVAVGEIIAAAEKGKGNAPVDR